MMSPLQHVGDAMAMEQSQPVAIHRGCRAQDARVTQRVSQYLPKGNNYGLTLTWACTS